MYEASFGLKRRPFAATPDATCFLSAGPIQAALDEIVVCVEQGQGIAVLTAPAGTGKTLLCERLRSELDDRYETVFLRHASFLTRRALLQTILCELNYAYHHPSEQELRLELFPAIRALQPKREALVLICDEAHQLTDSLLEELRIFADFAELGRPLVRLVLVGQLSLEEKLAQPGLEAFNQRIRAHVSLSTFDQAGSMDYIDYRLTWAGGRTDEVFTPEALSMIVQASDGVPRCINQLADHSLLLAFVAEQRPAGEALVREALSDLRQLPLHWNEPHQSLSSSDYVNQFDHESGSSAAPIPASHDSSGFLTESTTSATSYSYEPDFDVSKSSSGFDSPGLDSLVTAAIPPSDSRQPNAADSFPSNETHRVEVGSDDWRHAVELFAARKSGADLIDAMQGIIPEPPNSSADEHSSKFTRRIQFHDLLQDAYAAASTAPIDETEQDESVDQDFSESSSGAPDSWNVNPAFDDHRGAPPRTSPTVSRDLNSLSQTTTNNFQEEVIVDRYASIDAGFEPPKVSWTDTKPAGEVRAEQVSASDSSWEASPHHRPVESSDSESFVDRGWNSGTVFGGRSDDETVEFETTISTQQISAVRSESHLKVNSSRLGEQDSSLREDGPHDNVDFSRISRDTPKIGGVEQIADEVYSLGDALRSKGVLSSNSDSILKTLRFEIDGVDRSTEPEVAASPHSAPPEAAWEAIETAPVESPAVEARPFRYLFSMLRRKQQGLS